MKLASFITALVFSATGVAFAVDKHEHGHAHQPLHGGVVVEVKDMDYELVVKANGLQLYVRDHGKPVDVSQASAKLTLLTGTDQQEVALSPAADKLEAKGSFKLAAKTKVMALVTLAGKSSTVRFVLK